jgi:small subunit ribosomal protein S21
MKDQNKRNRKNFKKAPRGGENKPVVLTVNDNLAGPGEAIQAQPLEVKVYGNNFDKALRAFRALVQKERILSSYKEKQSYEKPSDKRRRKRNESKRKLLELCSKGECRHAEHNSNKRSLRRKASSE